MTIDDLDRVYSFHVANAGKYLWPKSQDQFRQLIIEECLFEARAEDGPPAALCYVKSDPESDQYELGGIFVDEAHRSRGLADALAVVAIAAEFSMGEPPTGAELIAHVHIDNPSPRTLLKRIGFVHDGRQESFPGEGAPPNMPRNQLGQVVGDVFVFQWHACSKFAEWLSNFSGSTSGPAGNARVHIDVGSLRSERMAAAIVALRAIAER